MAHQIHRPTAHTLFSQTVLAPGWYVKFFATGTSTPVDVYTTSALSVAHDWPVEADAAGVLPAIYLNPTVVYKTEVYDQNDVLQPEYGADPANDQVVSQSIIGELLNPETAAEAGVTITNSAYLEGQPARYGFIGNGLSSSAADITAINAALSVVPVGGTVDVTITEAGLYLGENSITVPVGKKLRFRGCSGLPLSRFATNGSLNSASLPGMGMVIVTSTTLPAVILRSNSSVEGALFWCPDQNWNITSLAESFTTYTAIQLGDATDTGPYHPSVIGCQFIGPTACVTQYATDGSSVKGGAFEHLTGVLMGEGFRIARSTDVLHFSNCHFTPNAVTNFVGDSSVGGDADVFRAECAIVAKVFHFGKVDDFRAVDVFAFGVRNYVHWNTGFFTGDDDAGLGGTIIGGAADSCYQAFVVERGDSTIPVNIIGGWFAPNFRPTGSAGDSTSQAFIAYAASIANTRFNVVGVALNGGAVGEFPANYSGERDSDFISSGAIGSNNNINVSNFHTRNRGDVCVTAAMQGAVSLVNWSDEDVAQRPLVQDGYDTYAGGYYFDGTKVLGARATGWADAITGTETRTTFATGSVTLEQLAQRVAALINDLRTHGAIGP